MQILEHPSCDCDAASECGADPRLPTPEEALAMLCAYRDDPFGTLEQVLAGLNRRNELPAA